MRFGLGVLGISALLLSGAACNQGRYSSSSFHLPADGSVDRGKVAFVNLGCNSCHQVWGTELPQANVSLPEPVMLGGQTGRRLSDAYLVTVMLDPNHALAGHRRKGTAENERSRMESYTDQLSARQMVDIVAFLQSHYVVRHFTPNNTFE